MSVQGLIVWNLGAYLYAATRLVPRELRENLRESGSRGWPHVVNNMKDEDNRGRGCVGWKPYYRNRVLIVLMESCSNFVCMDPRTDLANIQRARVCGCVNLTVYHFRFIRNAPELKVTLQRSLPDPNGL